MLTKPEKPEPEKILFNVFEPVSVGYMIFQFANIELYLAFFNMYMISFGISV